MATRDSDQSIAEFLGEHLTVLTGAEDDFDEIVAMAKTARFVLLGEATHGTHEFYQARAEITKRLITELDFTAVAVEADWPDAYRVHRYVQGDKSIDNEEDALADFERFPKWMWRNSEVKSFVDWLYDYNHVTGRRAAAVGFYGLDLYSLNRSAQSVIGYLEKQQPEAAERARRRYGCFDTYGGDPESYGYATALDVGSSCEKEIIAQLSELQSQSYKQIMNGRARDEFFSAERNATLVKHAEHYFRALFKGRPSSWNIRDTHMADTLDAIDTYLSEKHGKPAKIVVWAHNSHIGDGRAIEGAKRGEVTLGQIVRERHSEETLLVGFSTYTGTVTAAEDWDSPVLRRTVLPARKDSYEALFHQVGVEDFLLNIRDNVEIQRLLGKQRLARAIGVVYRPDTERTSHYFEADLARQFDALIHIEHTRALLPLEGADHWKRGELAETYPFGT